MISFVLEFLTIFLAIFVIFLQWKSKLTITRFLVHLHALHVAYNFVFKLKKEDRLDEVKEIHKWYPKFLHLKFAKMLFVYDPEIVKRISNTQLCLQRPFSHFLPDSISKGLLFAKYRDWKNPRRHLNFSFNLNILKSFIPTLSMYADMTVKELEFNNGKGNFNVINFVSRWVYRTNSAIILNVHRVDLPDHENIFGSINTITERLFERFMNPLLYPEFIYKRTRSYQDFKKSTDFLIQYGNDLIDEARENVSKEKQKNSQNEFNRPKTHFLVEQLLIDQDEKYSDQEIRDQLLTLLITASDTTVNLVGACLMFLAINQEIQMKVYDEIIEVFGDDKTGDSEFDYERLNELRYLDQVMKETLRIFSPIPIYIRECIDDCDIGVGSSVGKGTKIYILSHILHHREDIWGPNSNQFDPENFSTEKISQRDSHAFVPFGSGQRNCIGYRYSMIASKIMITKLIKTFSFSTPLKIEDMRLALSFTGKLASPYLVSIVKRKCMIFDE